MSFPSALFFALLSFLVLAFCEPAWTYWLGPPAAFLAFGLFWWALPSLGKRRFLWSWLWFTAIQLFHLSWMTSTSEVGELILIVYALFSLGMGLQFALLCHFLPKEGALSTRLILGLGGFWVLMEMSRLLPLTGFTLNPVGLALAGYLPPLQFAGVGGIYFLSFWVIITNLFFLNCIRQKGRAWLPVLVVGLLPYLYGWAHLEINKDDYELSREISPLRAVLVQTGLRQSEKWPPGIGAEVLMRTLEQWESILAHLAPFQNQPVDLIVLPETSVPLPAFHGAYAYENVYLAFKRKFGFEVARDLPQPRPPMAERLGDPGDEFWAVSNAYWAQALAQVFGGEVVAGFDISVKDQEKSKVYNSAFLFHPEGSDPDRYDKRILVPMGEYIPFDLLKPIANNYGIYDSFTPGTDAAVFGTRIPIGFSICYEETRGSLMRETCLRGAQVLVNLSNDAWFPDSRLPLQHFYNSRLRAVENGIPMLRACNSGVTAAVDAFGGIVARVGDGNAEWESGAVYVELPTFTYWTPYRLWGDYFVMAISVVFILLGLPGRPKTGSNPDL